MDVQTINKHLYAMENAARDIAMDAQRSGGNGENILRLMHAQHQFFVLMAKEISSLQSEVDQLKAAQAPAMPAE